MRFVPGAASGAAAGGSVVTGRRRSIGRFEFTALLAMSMALGALGIDMMLPAFDAMRADLGLAADSNAIAGTVTTYFFGLALGTFIYGPLSDRYGRRRSLFISYGVYALGGAASALATSLELLLLTRFLWGIGAAGSRVITFAVIRDAYEGEEMSRAMSHVMAVFILVPIVAPTLGAVIVALASWRWVFGVCVALTVLMTAWTTRMTTLYGVLISYLGSSEIIFSEVFDQGTNFPYIFGGLAAVMGVAMLVNGRIVRAVGTRRMAHIVLLAYLGTAGGLLLLAVSTGGRPPLALFLVALGALFSGHALMIPNLNSIAMEPMARVAGTASSILGAAQLGIGALLGSIIDRMFDGTILPLAIGFMAYGLVAFSLIMWAEGGRLRLTSRKRRREPSAASAVPPR